MKSFFLLIKYLFVLLTGFSLLCQIPKIATAEDSSVDCLTARKTVSSLTFEKEDRAREEEGHKLCPQGAAGHFVNAMRFFRAGDKKSAIKELRSATASENNFAEAHGALGLLLLEDDPNEAAVELMRGLRGKEVPQYHAGLAELLKNRFPALALFHYREALKGDPGSTSLRLGLARSLVATGLVGEGDREYEKILLQEPHNVSALVGRAKIKKDAGRLDQALQMLTHVEGAPADNKELHQLLSDIYRGKGDAVNADREAQLAGIQIDASELIQKGDGHLLAREYAKAVDEYQAALNAKSDWPEALEKLADAQRAAGRDDDAIETYNHLVKIGKGDSDTYYMLGVLYERKGTLDKAETHYKESVRLYPDNGDARRRLADIYTIRGNFPLAIEEYKQLLALRGDNPLLHFKLARLYERNKRFPDAMEEYRAAISSAPENIEAHRELANLYMKRRMPDAAELQYREVLRLKMDDQDARNALMTLLVKGKKSDQLLDLLKEGVALDPDDPNSHYKLGLVHDYRKEFPLAVEEYKKAISLQNNHARALNALAKVYLKLGDYSNGRAMLEAAKKADPNLLEPRELLNNLRDEKVVKKRTAATRTRKIAKKKKKKVTKKRTTHQRR